MITFDDTNTAFNTLAGKTQALYAATKAETTTRKIWEDLWIRGKAAKLFEPTGDMPKNDDTRLMLAQSMYPADWQALEAAKEALLFAKLDYELASIEVRRIEALAAFTKGSL